MVTFMAAQVGSGTADGPLITSSTDFTLLALDPQPTSSQTTQVLSSKCRQPGYLGQLLDNTPYLILLNFPKS